MQVIERNNLLSRFLWVGLYPKPDLWNTAFGKYHVLTSLQNQRYYSKVNFKMYIL